MNKFDLILEKINLLSEKIDSNNTQARRELDNVNKTLDTANNTLNALDQKVSIQNGRLLKVESKQKHCPGETLNSAFTAYKTDMKSVYIIATNYKLIIILVVGGALAFQITAKLLSLASSYLSTFLPL